MSDLHEPGTEELERRLDAAFQSTRPRRGFEDELWARLRARRHWWRRLGDGLQLPWGRVAAGIATVALVGLAAVLVRASTTPHGGAATTAAAPATGRLNAPAAAPASTAGLPFGRLPAPAGAGVVQALRPSGPSALPPGGQRVDTGSASLPVVGSRLAVYRFDPATGPAVGSVVDQVQVPAGLQSGFYPSRPPVDAAAGAGGAGQSVALTQVRLAYVAVVAGDRGYLEPVYVYTGTAGGGPVQLLVSALDPAALQ
ncbi:MAG: hypothetical protein E6J41_14665 [Chloroflexi bacterium]|nr:MAG: hypothetical protein E6J41_14665 [Chloroflexota bacterium]